jgi:FAD/FMN-containing dehydrogenase
MAALMPGLERRLRAEIGGDVLFDRFSRGRYATDASHYQIMPVGVVAPRSMSKAERAIAIARQEGLSVLARGGGTSQAGQTVNASLVIDCSKHLNRILELDVPGRRCVVEPADSVQPTRFRTRRNRFRPCAPPRRKLWVVSGAP